MAEPKTNNNDAPRELEITTGRTRRLINWVGYVLLMGVVAALLVIVLLQFTTSVALAVGLVLFMIAYMILMGWLASRKMERRE